MPSSRGEESVSKDKRAPFLFGLGNASHDFSDTASLGKNIFTNAFPIAVAQYLSIERNLPIPLIKARYEGNSISTYQEMVSWEHIIGTNPRSATFLFEEVYNGFKIYTDKLPNKSDIVVSDESGQHRRPFEVKLVVVPNSNTASRPHEEQSCEIVVRPPTIEQLAFSIANSYGSSRRALLLDIISDALRTPMDYQWANESWMRNKIPRVAEAANEIGIRGIELQTPFVINAIWRTQGQRPILHTNAFDVFVWTDMAFLQLFTDNSSSTSKSRKITRAERSLVWLISALFDYAAQRTLNFSKHHSNITYGAQTDKAASYAGDTPLKHLKSNEFFHPRVSKLELEKIMTRDALEYLMPERRLDNSIMIQHLINTSDK